MAQSPEPLRRMETMDVVCPHCQAHFQVDPNMPADQPARALHAADEFVEAGGTPALPAGAQVEAGGTPALPAVAQVEAGGPAALPAGGPAALPPGGPPALLAAPAPPELEISEDDAVFREKVVAHILSKDLEIPLLPHVAMNVIKLTNDARSSMQDLARVVLTDQGIASRILKIANSPVYAGAVEVKTISQALVRLGQREVKNLMLAISLQGRVFKSASYQSLARKLWEHSIAVAFSSRVVANALRLPKEEAFLAGLMHDMGKMVLLNLIERCLREMPVKYRPSMPLVLDTLRQFNADVGEMVVARWDLPDEIRRAVRRGEPRPDGTPTDADAVAIGNAIAEIKAIGPDTWDGPLYEHPAAMNLHLSREACEELIRRFDQMYEPARGLFG